MEPTALLDLQDVLQRPNQPLREPPLLGCVHDQGGMADYFTIHANRVHVIPDDSATSRPCSSSRSPPQCHAVKLSGGVQYKAVVIIGAGTIGLLVLAAARHAGARRIVMTDMLRSKRERALRLGADAVVDAGTPTRPRRFAPSWEKAPTSCSTASRSSPPSTKQSNLPSRAVS